MSSTSASPSALQTLCLHAIESETFRSTQDSPSQIDTSSTWLPVELSQEIFDFCIADTVADEVNQVLKLFLKNPERTPLQRICLQNLRHADVNLIKDLVTANKKILTHLDIRGCRSMPKKVWCVVNEAQSLLSLKTTQLVIPLRCPNLEVLVVDWKPRRVAQRMKRRFKLMYFDELIANVLPNLTHLDLSWCPWTKRLKTLGAGSKLKVLILRNCDISTLVDDIAKLPELRNLDVSVGMECEINREFNGEYENPKYIVDTLLMSLNKLEHFDISGTNLDLSILGLGITKGGDCHSNEESKLGLGRSLKFLGLYSTDFDYLNAAACLPEICMSGSSDNVQLLEAIKRNSDMPKTMRRQLATFMSNRGSNIYDANELLKIQIKMINSIRINDYFRLWSLRCTYNYLDHLENPSVQINAETRKDLFLAVNRLIYSHLVGEGMSELLLCLAFQIYLKLLPADTPIEDKATRREMMRCGRFALSLKTTSFVYLKTEALLFRLLHRFSLEPRVCRHLSENKAIHCCVNFFKTLQFFLGFSLNIYQTSEIVPLVWSSINNFMGASPEGSQDFLRLGGLSWIYAHTNWFTNDERTKKELCIIFLSILSHLEKFLDQNTIDAYGMTNPRSHRTKLLLEKLKDLVWN